MLISIALALTALAGTVQRTALRLRIDALEARATAAETKLRAVTWLAERRTNPAAVRADSIRRACYQQIARNGGADCGL